jgi:hypothetical protein
VSFDNLVALQRAMEAAGVIFLDAGDELATTAAVNDKCGGRCHYRPASVKPPDAPAPSMAPLVRTPLLAPEAKAEASGFAIFSSAAITPKELSADDECIQLPMPSN